MRNSKNIQHDQYNTQKCSNTNSSELPIRNSHENWYTIVRDVALIWNIPYYEIQKKSFGPLELEVKR